MKIANIPYFLLIVGLLLLFIGIYKIVSVKNALQKIKDDGGKISQAEGEMWMGKMHNGQALVSTGAIIIIINALTYDQWE